MLELLALVCLAATWLVPNHYPPWLSFYRESCAAVALGLLVLALGRKSWTNLPWSAWVVVAAASLPWLHWALGMLAFSGDAIVSSLYLLGLAIAIGAGYVWARVDRQSAADRLAWAILVGALGCSLLALMQALMIQEMGVWLLDPELGARPAGNLGQPNNLATAIGLGIVGLLLLYERQRVTAVSASLFLTVLLVGIALTQSRTALLFGPALVTGLWLARRRGVALRLGLGAALLIVVIQWTLTWTVPRFQDMVLLGGPVSLAERGVSSLRASHWVLLFKASMTAPWLGFGWLQVGTAELAMAGRYPPIEEFWMFAHNLFLDLLIWCGYPLGLLLSALILYWYVSRARRVDTLEGVTGMLAVTIFGIHAMLELPHHYAYFLIPIGIWIGQVECAVGAIGRLRPPWAVLPALAAVGMLAGVWIDYPEVEEDFRLLRFENLRIGSLRAAQPAPDAPFLTNITAYVRAARVEPVAGMSVTDLAQARAVAERYPYPNILYRLARAQALNGQAEEARKTLVKLEYMHGKARMPRLLQDVRDRITAGEAGLQALERVFPP